MENKNTTKTVIMADRMMSEEQIAELKQVNHGKKLNLSRELRDG